MLANAIYKLRSELNVMIESRYDLKDGSLSEPGFVADVLAIEKKLESYYNDSSK